MVVPGIHESVKLEWSGDVDQNDGEVQKMRESYLNRLSFLLPSGWDQLVTRNTSCPRLRQNLKKI